MPEVWVSIPIAVTLALLVQAVKQAVPEDYHRFIPLGLLFVGPAVGVGLAFVMGNPWQGGIVEGLMGSAGAVYGFEFVKGVAKAAARSDE